MSLAMQHESESNLSMAMATTQGTGPIDQENEDQMIDMGGDAPDAEIVTRTNVQLTELPLSLEEIQTMVFELATSIRVEEQEQTLKAQLNV